MDARRAESVGQERGVRGLSVVGPWGYWMDLPSQLSIQVSPESQRLSTGLSTERTIWAWRTANTVVPYSSDGCNSMICFKYTSNYLGACKISGPNERTPTKRTETDILSLCSAEPTEGGL